MTTKEEMLTYIATKEEYEQLRDYCVPCKGTGHIHILLEVKGRTRPQNLICTACYGEGYLVRQNYNLLKDLFKNNNTQNIITLTKQENGKFMCFIDSQNDENMVISNNKDDAILERIFLWEKYKKGGTKTHKK